MQAHFVDAPVAHTRVPAYKVQLVREASVTMPERLTSPGAVAKAVDYLGTYDREHFVVILLNTKARIIGVNTVSIGSLNASIVHPREVFKPAVILGAASVILVHNHPSGDPSPSQEDRDVTKRLSEAGHILGITVLDSLIIGDGCYFSFKEKGLL